jgi:NAD(P)H-hydrate epimerase
VIRLSREKIRRIDQLASEQYGIPGIVLMENAARAAADVALQMLGEISSNRTTIFCGGGNNGGDGLAVARHLHNRGIAVRIVQCFDPIKLPADAATNWRIVQAMLLEILPLEKIAMVDDLAIDALLGTGVTSPPRDRIKQAIELVNSAPAVLAIDLPSGLDADTGQPLGECVRATKTVTFVAEKFGFADPASRQYTGEIIVGDIGCPRELIDAVR